MSLEAEVVTDLPSVISPMVMLGALVPMAPYREQRRTDLALAKSAAQSEALALQTTLGDALLARVSAAATRQFQQAGDSMLDAAESARHEAMRKRTVQFASRRLDTLELEMEANAKQAGEVLRERQRRLSEELLRRRRFGPF